MGDRLNVVRYRLIVLGCNGAGRWSELMRRSGIHSEALADLLGREEMTRLMFRTSGRRFAYKVERENVYETY